MCASHAEKRSLEHSFILSRLCLDVSLGEAWREAACTLRACRHIANRSRPNRNALLVPSGRGLIRYGSSLAPFQIKDFKALDSAFVALRDGREPACKRFWIERTKGSSKDSDCAVLILWLLAFCPRSLSCQVGAADRDQAVELKKAAVGILQQNGWLGQLVEAQAWSLLNRHTGSVCDIIPADVAGSHGARPDLLVLNELAHITKREFAENLMDNAEKVPNGLVIVATNSGILDSWSWEWRQNAKNSERWYFSNYDQPLPVGARQFLRAGCIGPV